MSVVEKASNSNAAGGGLNDTSIDEDLFLRDGLPEKSRSNSVMNQSRERVVLQKGKSIEVHGDETFNRGVTQP